jgi:hypothetical protein
MAKNRIINGQFQSADGVLLSNGWLSARLSFDCQDSSTMSQIVSGISIRIPLDQNGSVSGTVLLWVNSTLTPAGSFYIVDAYDSKGEQAWRTSQFLTIPASPSPFDLGTWVLNSPVPAGPSSSSTFQTNGVNNSVQSLLDLVAGTNITLTDTNGHTTINAAAGGNDGLYFFGPGLIDTAVILGAGTIGSGVSAGQSGGVVAANVVTVYKFTLPMPFTISKVTTQCLDNLGGTSTFGIYNSAGTKVIDGGSFPNVTASIVTHSITPVILPSGVYWHAQAATLGNNPHYPGFVISSNSIVSGNIVPFFGQNSTKNGTAANPLVAGVLPATLGAITPFTPTNGNGDGICCPLYE